MANMNVSYDELQTAANQLRTGQQALQDQLTSLQSFIQNLVSSGFVTDQASGAFNETYDGFTKAANATVGNLEKLAINLESTARILQDTDSQLAAGLRG
jgi:WXG100 family type VII secretion target